ncbi:TonB-dependent receptor plug domain-containing protein [Mangrovimonas sp. ST2L15]|uniref:TonB-dependent receptor n=1 Tax=Mangrovimonas sp. ST2L15 TaxID=1645916 RepID=UPI0006B42C01|nr:TonB-dependent receptor plug domain-containing protein [Mangrovimonas sp. ST2L15]
MIKSLLTFCLLFIISSLAQGQTMQGHVLDENNKPLDGAYLYNENSKKHAHSNESGSFILEGNQVNDSITIGLLGFEKKIRIVSQEDLNNLVTIHLVSKAFLLDELVLTNEVNALHTVAKLDLETNPVNSSQDILRKVPGLIIGQHAGGGKAEQIFLRGFDVDHGTDVSISVDGMPVNMVSHAHGQGYSDLHFLIPETINNIEFGKGPYYAEKGDFATAAYVDFNTKERLDESEVLFSYGQFNSLRTVGLFNLMDKSGSQNAYAAIEYIETDGPFESPQNFNRLNLFGKYTALLKDHDKISFNVSHFTSRWDASGQIPQRAVDSGLISRFGAIDDTEGGNTSRSNINVSYMKFMDDNTSIKANAFYSHYNFELYSNFTFFLEDPVNGDQIKQYEGRDILGFNAEIKKHKQLGEIDVNISSGAGLRHDIINDIELSHTLNRIETLEYMQLGDVNQTNLFTYVNTEFLFGALKVAPALRLDYFKFMYNDHLTDSYATQSNSKTALSPKLNVFFTQNENLQWYLKSGIGFHSNDARVVLQERKDILPRAYGVDLGTTWKPIPKMLLNVAVWTLLSEQEFVYVGDAGIVEPSGKSERYGVDLGVRYQFTNWLYADTDATYTHARAAEEPSGMDYIPLAPDFTWTGGLAVVNLKGFSGGIRYRYVDDRPANEDNSIVAEGYFVTDFNVAYEYKNMGIGITIENLFDVDWNETQFATESRLFNEPEPVEEIHFTPGTPFYIRGNLTYKF